MIYTPKNTTTPSLIGTLAEQTRKKWQEDGFGDQTIYSLDIDAAVEKPDNNGKVNDNNDINDKEILTNGHVVVEVSSEDHMTSLLTPAQKQDQYDLVWAKRRAL